MLRVRNLPRAAPEAGEVDVAVERGGGEGGEEGVAGGGGARGLMEGAVGIRGGCSEVGAVKSLVGLP